MLHVGVSELKDSRDRMSRGAEILGSTDHAKSACLLLFYAAECGLKAALLDRNGLRSTRDLEGYHHHDIRKLMIDLKLEKGVVSMLRACRTKSGVVEVSELHQAWRYGVKLYADDEKLASEALRSVIRFCRETQWRGR